MRMSRVRNRKNLLHEGKTKSIFFGSEPGTLIKSFKDQIVTDDNQIVTVSGKAVLTNRISEAILLKLSEIGIPNFFIKTLNMYDQLVKEVDLLPIKVIVRNVAAGSISVRLGIEEGIVLPQPVIEFYLKHATKRDTMLNEDHITIFNFAEKYELEEIRALSLRINDFLSGLFNGIGVRLIDFKIEFGRIIANQIETIILADDITPDTCRLWDLKTNEILDKNRYNKDPENVIKVYREIAKRLKIIDRN